MEDALAVEHRENKFLLALRKLATEHRDAQVLVVTASTGSDCRYWWRLQVLAVIAGTGGDCRYW